MPCVAHFNIVFCMDCIVSLSRIRGILPQGGFGSPSQSSTNISITFSVEAKPTSCYWKSFHRKIAVLSAYYHRVACCAIISRSFGLARIHGALSCPHPSPYTALLQPTLTTLPVPIHSSLQTQRRCVSDLTQISLSVIVAWGHGTSFGSFKWQERNLCPPAADGRRHAGRCK